MQRELRKRSVNSPLCLCILKGILGKTESLAMKSQISCHPNEGDCFEQPYHFLNLWLWYSLDYLGKKSRETSDKSNLEIKWKVLEEKFAGKPRNLAKSSKNNKIAHLLILMEEETVTHYSIFAGKNPWTEEPGRLQPKESQSWTRLSDWARWF